MTSLPYKSSPLHQLYPFTFNFVVAHFYGAIVFTASLFLHVALKLPTIRHAYRERGGNAVKTSDSFSAGRSEHIRYVRTDSEGGRR